MPLNHIALVKFKPGTSDKVVVAFFEGVGRLRQAVPGIEGYSWGANNSPEGLSQGYTHGFVLTFKDAAVRAAYLPHPLHQDVVKDVLPHVESVVVLDYDL